LTLDHIGQTHFNKQHTLLKYGGTLVSCGATTGYDAQIDLRHIFFKGINVLGSTQGTKAEMEQGLYWMGQGKIKAALIQFILSSKQQRHIQKCSKESSLAKS